MSDPVNSPSHYNLNPWGIETYEITKHFSFTMGNVLKYLMRADYKENRLQDLEKAAWYLAKEIANERAKRDS